MTRVDLVESCRLLMGTIGPSVFIRCLPTLLPWGPGVCYRLYSEEEFLNFPPFNLPEIQRVRLEAVVLQIKQLAGAASDPRFTEPPRSTALLPPPLAFPRVLSLCLRGLQVSSP